jgi:hypothetical protein
MNIEYRKAQFAMAWMAALVVVGIASGMTSLIGWGVLAGLAVVPPAVIMRFRHEPDKTMSESIREGLR